MPEFVWFAQANQACGVLTTHERGLATAGCVGPHWADMHAYTAARACTKVCKYSDLSKTEEETLKNVRASKFDISCHKKEGIPGLQNRLYNVIHFQ